MFDWTSVRVCLGLNGYEMDGSDDDNALSSGQLDDNHASNLRE